MNYNVEKKDQKAIFTITISAEEVTKGMKHAAKHVSEHTNIPGFRPGKADYETVKKRVGAMKLLDEATEELLRSAFVQAMLDEDLETAGQPYFEMVKAVPEEELVFTVEIALYPKVKKIADWKNKLKVEAKDTKPTQELIDQAKGDIARMQTKEVRATSKHALVKGDKAVVNLTMKKDGVVLEGGEGRDHGIYTAESYYIEGFIDEILGMKEGESKSFKLTFPDDYGQKHLAGQEIEFTVEIKELFQLEVPEINDEFAKTVGLKDLAELEEKIRENLQMENEMEEARRLDKETLDLLAEKSSFEEISDLLVNQEIEKMIHELKHTLTQQGMEMEQYLNDIGKSMADLKIDFSKTALTRIKVAILLKQIAKEEGIAVKEEDIDKELDGMAARYEDAEMKKRIYEPQYRDYVTSQMTNRLVIDTIKAAMTK